jgi:hypothetical protein
MDTTLDMQKMKREIKFRAWDGKFWYEWAEVPMKRDWVFVRWENTRTSVSAICKAWDDESLLKVQFTGRHDKNGKEIYESHIVKTETEKAMQVSWNVHFASFCLDRAGWMFTHYFGEAVDPTQIEIIGNIFENPELLK